MSRDLELARLGALRFVPAAMVTDEMLRELDEWSEIGWVVLECGCFWRLDDVDAVDDHPPH